MRQCNLNIKKCVCEVSEKSLKENVLEFHGVPNNDKENIIELVGKVSISIGFVFDEKIIYNCHRFKSIKDLKRLLAL